MASRHLIVCVLYMFHLLSLLFVFPSWFRGSGSYAVVYHPALLACARVGVCFLFQYCFAIHIHRIMFLLRFNQLFSCSFMAACPMYCTSVRACMFVYVRARACRQSLRMLYVEHFTFYRDAMSTLLCVEIPKGFGSNIITFILSEPNTAKTTTKTKKYRAPFENACVTGLLQTCLGNEREGTFSSHEKQKNGRTMRTHKKFKSQNGSIRVNCMYTINAN